MNRRALFLALIVALLGAALLVVYLRRFEQEASGGEPISLLIALKPIESGSVLTDEMLATRVVPRAYVEDRAVLARDRAKVIGLRMGQTIQAQQLLMWTDLKIAMDEQSKLSDKVQPGMRAVTVAAHSRGDKSYALIRPGDRIDVIATVTTEKAGDAQTSVVLLQNVLVLAVGVDTGGEFVEKSGGRTQESAELLLSLSIRVEEAQLLALATEKGKLSVALRNPDDIRVFEGLVDLASSALSDMQTRERVQGPRKATVSPIPVKIEAPGGDPK